MSFSRLGWSGRMSLPRASTPATSATAEAVKIATRRKLRRKSDIGRGLYLRGQGWTNPLRPSLSCGLVPEPGAPTVYDQVGGRPFFEAVAARFYAGVATDPVLRP